MPQEIFHSIAKKSGDNEYYTPVPDGYKIGKTKYIVIFGTVISGLGKGIFAAALAKLLQDHGLNCSPIKFDGYLNIDAGTLNPYRHGEVFVLDDGTESDMDLGTYERFLDKNITQANYLTAGKLFSHILNREREGKYLGRDVQFIPHVTGEIKGFIRNLAIKSEADVVLIEVGGTVGDIENSYFIEAMRELRYEEGKDNVIFAALTYIIKPNALGEQKSKAAQLGLRQLMSLGIQPRMIACRSETHVSEKVREKLSIYADIPVEKIISLHDVDSIYRVPQLLHEAKFDQIAIDMLKLNDRIHDISQENLEKWNKYINNLSNPSKIIKIGITGKYTGLRDSYASIIKSIEHSATNLGIKVDIEWIDTTDSNIEEKIKHLNGIIVPGGFGKRGTEGKIKCIKYARENNIPFLGLCLGFQMAVLDHARHVCNIPDACSTELDPQGTSPVIDILPEQKEIEGFGGNMRLGGRYIEVKEGSLAHKCYKSTKIRERFRHRFEVNPKFIKTLEENNLIFSGKAPDQPIMQILERPDHKFFMASQFHPEYTSRPLKPNPMFLEFIKAASN